MKEYTTHDDHEYIHVTDIDGVAVVCFNDLDRVEMGEYETLAEELLTVVDQDKWPSIILDFEGEVFIPWAAFEAVLVRLHMKANDRLKMCGLPPFVMEHFEINRLAELFHISPTREEALRASPSGNEGEGAG